METAKYCELGYGIIPGVVEDDKDHNEVINKYVIYTIG